MAWYKRILKPFFDLIGAFLLLILLFPLIILLLLISAIFYKKPFFAQKRIGENERAFTCYKFRSMRVDGDEKSVTAWGGFLRKTSLDELPQLFNILKGEMSFIGPRPLLPEYLEHYSPEQAKRHRVKPGITGLAQVKGRNKLSWEASLAFDTYYATHCTFTLDISILAQTIPQLLKFSETEASEGVSREAFNKQKK